MQARRRRRPGPGASGLAQAIGDADRGQRLPRDRALAHAARDRRAGARGRRRARLTRPLTELGSPESVREVVSQRLSRLARADRRAARARGRRRAPEFELEHRSRRAVRADEGRRSLEALDEGVRSGMIEEVSALGWRTASPTSSCAGRCTTGSTGVRRARAPPACRRGDRGRPRRHRRIAFLADLAYHFARRRRSAASSARGRLQRPRGAGRRTSALAFDEARLLTSGRRSSSESPTGASVRRCSSSSGRRNLAPVQSLDCLKAFRAAAEIARELDDPELFAQAAVGYENACWRPGIRRSAAPSSCWRRPPRRSAGGRDAAPRHACSPGWPAHSAGRGNHDRGALVQASAIAMARRLDDRTRAGDGADARVLGARHESARGRSSRCSNEAVALAASSATSRSRPRPRAGGWRRSSALGDLPGARAESRRLCSRSAEKMGQPFWPPRRRALRLGARAERRSARRGGANGRAFAGAGGP